MGQGDSLVETLIEAVRDVDSCDDYILETIVKVITLLHDKLEIGATSDDNTTNVRSVIGDEVLSGQLTALDDVQMALLLSETCETNSRLTTTTVLFGQLHWHALDDLLVISLQSGEKHSITVDDDKAEFVVVLQER